MANNPNAAQNLKPFTKDDPRINKTGRPRKFVTLMKDQGYSQSEISDTYTAMLACTVKELMEIYNHPDATGLEKATAMSIKNAITRGSLFNIEVILTRVFGKPKETVDQTITGNLTAPVMVNVVKSPVPLATSEKEVLQRIEQEKQQTK